MRLQVVEWQDDNIANRSDISNVQHALFRLVQLLEKGFIEFDASNSTKSRLAVSWFSSETVPNDDGSKQLPRRSARILLDKQKQGEDQNYWLIYLLLANHLALYAWEILPHAMHAWKERDYPGGSPEDLVFEAQNETLDFGGENFEIIALAHALQCPEEAKKVSSRRMSDKYLNRFIDNALIGGAGLAA